MEYEGKTNKDLIVELKQLQREHNSLKNSFKKKLKEIRQAEEKLLKSEEQYSLLIDMMPDGVYKTTDAGNFETVNQAMFSMLGYDSKEELMAIDIKTQLYFELSDRDSTTLKEKNKELGIYKLKKKDGSEIWVEDHGWLNYNKSTNILYHEGILRDITERKQAEEALRESEKRFRLMYENTPVAYQSLNIDGCLIDVNPSWLNTLGYTKEEVLGKHFGSFMTPSSAKLICSRFPNFIAEGKIHKAEFEMLRKDGSSLFVSYEGTIGNDEFGNFKQSHCIFIDITERKKAEEKMRSSKQLVESIIDSIPVRVFWKDKNLVYLGCNSAFAVDAGFSDRKEIIGKDDYQMGWSKQAHMYRNNDKCVIEKGVSKINIEEQQTTPEGNEITLLTSKIPLKDSNGAITGILGTYTDITDRKKAEKELILTKEKAEESDRLKSAFLANMSHEIRTPMNGILGFSELLKNPNLTGDQQKRFIEIIDKSGKRMLNIINDIVDISKIEAGLMKLQLKESNINKQIEYVHTFFKPEVEAKGMQLIFKNALPNEEAFIKIDREKLFAILTNLVKNAIKYTNEGAIEFGYVLKTNTKSLHQNTELEFFVKDTGIGIPKDRQLAIFERFIQADITDTMARQGAGLGLSITKSYIEMLGGKIWVQSEEGKGSTFYFTLPYTLPIKEKNNAKELKTSGNLKNIPKKLNILIAEDDEISQLLISNYVSEFGNQIKKAKSGVEALKICSENPDIDLILMDIQMPEMNGYEATREIRKFNKNVIIIAQTAYGLSGDKEKSINAGCNDYITKPINKKELDTLIKKYFNH